MAARSGPELRMVWLSRFPPSSAASSVSATEPDEIADVVRSTLPG